MDCFFRFQVTVSDGHEVSASTSSTRRRATPISPPEPANGSRRSGADPRDQLERQILVELEARSTVTQRSLASDLGIALGLSNLLMRRLVKKGWVRIKHVSPGRIRYLITPAGLLAKARLTRQYFLSSLTFYRECRERMRERLAAASAELVRRGDDRDSGGVVFYGRGEIAEVAYVCLHETRLTLVGLVDSSVSRSFFHVPVHDPSDLSGLTLADQPFSMLIVMPSEDEDEVITTLAERGVPYDRVFWL